MRKFARCSESRLICMGPLSPLQPQTLHAGKTSLALRVPRPRRSRLDVSPDHLLKTHDFRIVLAEVFHPNSGHTSNSAILDHHRRQVQTFLPQPDFANARSAIALHFVGIPALVS